jgi:hypothetical protein
MPTRRQHFVKTQTVFHLLLLIFNNYRYHFKESLIALQTEVKHGPPLNWISWIPCLESVATASRAGRLNVAVLLGGGRAAVGWLARGPEDGQVARVFRALQRLIAPHPELGWIQSMVMCVCLVLFLILVRVWNVSNSKKGGIATKMMTLKVVSSEN